MVTSNIMVFAGKYLEHNVKITPEALQRFIWDDPSVGKRLPIEDIKDALDTLVTASFLEVADGNKMFTVYKRHVPPFLETMIVAKSVDTLGLMKG